MPPGRPPLKRLGGAGSRRLASPTQQIVDSGLETPEWVRSGKVASGSSVRHWRVRAAARPGRETQRTKVRPSRQRIPNRASRHASSVPKRSRKAAPLMALIAYHKPSAVAKPRLDPQKPQYRAGYV